MLDGGVYTRVRGDVRRVGKRRITVGVLLIPPRNPDEANVSG
jgi:hypothetical protein